MTVRHEHIVRSNDTAAKNEILRNMRARGFVWVSSQKVMKLRLPDPYDFVPGVYQMNFELRKGISR